MTAALVYVVAQLRWLVRMVVLACAAMWPPAPAPAPTTPPPQPEATTTAPEPEQSPTTTTAAVETPQPMSQGWAELRACESGGDYGAVSPGGAFRGAYQFSPGTWDGVADRLGRPDLVGVDPAAASPADQDAMAAQLYAERGAQPWPYCGRYLP